MRHVFLSTLISTFLLFAFSTTFLGEERIYTDSDVVAFLNQAETQNQTLPVVAEEPAKEKAQDKPRQQARQEKSLPEKAQPKEKIAQQMMTGKVVRITNESLTLQTTANKTSSVEHVFPLNSEIELKSLKSTSELKRGDIIQIKYEQHYRETSDQGKFISKTVVTLIEWLQTASAGSVYRSMEDGYEEKWSGEGE